MHGKAKGILITSERVSSPHLLIASVKFIKMQSRGPSPAVSVCFSFAVLVNYFSVKFPEAKILKEDSMILHDEQAQKRKAAPVPSLAIESSWNLGFMFIPGCVQTPSQYITFI